MLAVAGEISGNAGTGVRGELDLFRRGGFTLGIAAGASSMRIREMYSVHEFSLLELHAGASLAYAAQRGRWQLRLQGGVGRGKTRPTPGTDGPRVWATSVYPSAEASAMLAREVLEHWAISAGPMVAWSRQELRDDMGLSFDSGPDASFVLGIRRRL
jgi:hypothetical protein